MKKFEDGDIFYNTIKTYPKVSLFLNNGVANYNKQNHNDNSSRINKATVGTNELINPIYTSSTNDAAAAVDGALLLENGDILITEGGDNIIT